MSKLGGRLNHDQNNNKDVDNSGSSTTSNAAIYIERHLELGAVDDFLIIPNGGTGDCMFKAVSQAVFKGDESRHSEIRRKVVDFIISQRWEKFSEFIEVQHINGNNLLQRQWTKDPRQTYKMYMNLSGTLGSSSELTAAAELYQYNFATIQEYCNSDKRTYRVENCVLFDREHSDFHYFYFTGDFDNGHWEYIRNLSDVKIEDGTYTGRHRIVIEGEDISIESWLERETENSNAADQLKILTNRPLYKRRRSQYPFEMANCFRFEKDNTVKVNGTRYRIENLEHTDLFSVLARECLQNEGTAHEIELVLIKHRYSYFEDINNKLITQPWSHNFNTEAIKYCSYPCKGNVQDLICAADLYSFSFVLFIKLEDTYEESGEGVHQCKFTHVDRWGGENDRILHFFMRLAPAGVNDGLIAKWWLLTPYIEEKPSVPYKSKSKQVVMESSDTNNSRSSVMVGSVHVYQDDMKVPIYNSVTRPATGNLGEPTRTVFQPATPGPMSMTNTTSSNYSEQPFYHEDIYDGDEEVDIPPNSEIINLSGMATSEEDDIGDSKSSLTKDFENIFGTDTVQAKQVSLPLEYQEVRLVKKSIRTDKMKPATGRDLAKRPQKVRTVVKLKDKNSSNREITYRGKGYIHADDVLEELKSQGLIRLPSQMLVKRPASSLPNRNDSPFDRIFTAVDEVKEPREEKDENFNLIQRGKSAIVVSDISYENHDWLDEVFEDEQEKAKTRQKLNVKKLFSDTLSSYISKDKLKVKRNKVSPKSSDSMTGQGERHVHEDSANETLPCFAGFVKLIARLSASFLKMSRAIKKRLRTRYKRYNRSASAFRHKEGKKKKQSPKWEEELTNF